LQPSGPAYDLQVVHEKTGVAKTLGPRSYHGRSNDETAALPDKKEIDRMARFVLGRCLSWCLCCLIGSAAALLLPGVSWAQDPLDQGHPALIIELPRIPDEQPEKKRPEAIDVAPKALKTISQLRREYKESESEEIGKSLADAIRTAAKDPKADEKVKEVIAILIAEIADDEKLDYWQVKDKFARHFTDVAVELAGRKNSTKVRQAAVHALGKITPPPEPTFKEIQNIIKEKDPALSRFAANALIDLVKNAPHLKGKEKLDTIRSAIRAAAGAWSAFRDSDEWVCGYALQAIQESAKTIADQLSEEYSPGKTGKDKKSPVKLSQELLGTFMAFKEINPQLLEALRDQKLKIRLTALQALSEVAIARSETIRILREEKEQKKLLDSFYQSDPLAGVIQKLKDDARLFEKGDVDPMTNSAAEIVLATQLRRGVIDFLELLGDQAAPAIDEITEALNDPDRLVRWSAARTISKLPPEKVSEKAVLSLAFNLLVDGDSDLTEAAAVALEALGRLGHDPAKGGRSPAAQAVSALGIVIIGGDIDNRSWDVETRIKAMKALVSIGRPAHAAIPNLIKVLKDRDFRVRRQAAETLGRLGRPDNAALAKEAEDALRERLRDEDAEVRLNASAAILSITTTK
jgi:HEAT repeat protein